MIFHDIKNYKQKIRKLNYVDAKLKDFVETEGQNHLIIYILIMF